MVNLKGTNPVSGDSVDVTDPADWKGYAIGGIAIVGAVAFGRYVTDMASDATSIGDTVSSKVMELS